MEDDFLSLSLLSPLPTFLSFVCVPSAPSSSPREKVSAKVSELGMAHCYKFVSHIIPGKLITK